MDSTDPFGFQSQCGNENDYKDPWFLELSALTQLPEFPELDLEQSNDEMFNTKVPVLKENAAEVMPSTNYEHPIHTKSLFTSQTVNFAVHKDFVKQYSVRQRYSSFLYLFQDEQLDDLPNDGENGTTTSTASAISKFDTWFSNLDPWYYESPAKQALKQVIEKMLAMDESLPPFIRVCELFESERGILLAHFTHMAKKKDGVNSLKANSKGLLMTSFQRAFRMYDVKHNRATALSMQSWKKHPAYKEVKKQCVLQLKEDAKIPLANQQRKTTSDMDLPTYKAFLEYLTKKQNELWGVHLQDYCYYANAEFAACTLVFGGSRGASELANLSIKCFQKLDNELLHFLQSGITKGNQTGGDSNFTVKTKPDLYFLGKHLVHIFDVFCRKRAINPDGEFVNERLFLKPLPSATFQHDIWFGNEHVGKNNINYVSYITQEMQEQGILPAFLKFDNTSLRKFRTQALSDAGIEDWITAASMGQKDKHFQNLSFYRKMNHQDKLDMAKVLSDPWRYSKKRTIVDEVDSIQNSKFVDVRNENCPPPVKQPKPTVIEVQPPLNGQSPLDQLHKMVSLTNCSNIVMNVYLGK